MHSSVHARLDALVAAQLKKPFDWNGNNCCTFAADWVLAITGVDHMAEYRDIKTALQAARALRKLGGLASAASVIGPEVLPGMARYGDITLVAGEKGRASLAPCIGPSVVAPSATGLVCMPLEWATKAWRVQ